MITYSPDKTEHRQAAVRCGLRLKKGLGQTVVLLDDRTGEVVFQGLRENSWDYLRVQRGLLRGAH